MDQLMQANLQIIELLGAVFEEVGQEGMRAASRRLERPLPLRRCVGRPRPDGDITMAQANATN